MSYKHKSGRSMLHVICILRNTIMYGDTLLAEDQNGEFVPLCLKDVDNNYTEITKVQYESHFH